MFITSYFFWSWITIFTFTVNMGALKKIFFFLLVWITFFSSAQEDCFLGLGGEDHDKIISVFQLSDEQKENLKNWGAELEYRNEIFKIRAERLLKNHAQKSPEDLLNLSFKYRALLDSMRNNLRMLDKRMLSTFNDKQYNLYIELCNSVLMSPIYANRVADVKKKKKGS